MMNSAAVETVFESRDRGTLTGFQSPTFVIDTSKYLPWLMRKLEALTKRWGLVSCCCGFTSFGILRLTKQNWWALYVGVQFRYILAFVPIWECHEWWLAPVSTCVRSGRRGDFRRECCTGGGLAGAQRVNCFLALETSRAHIFMTRTDPYPSQQTCNPS